MIKLCYVCREYILLNYLENVSSKLVVRSLIQGNTFTKDLAIEKGIVTSFAGEIEDKQLFIKFQSFVVPNRIYKLDFETSEIEVCINRKPAANNTFFSSYCSWRFLRM